MAPSEGREAEGRPALVFVPDAKERPQPKRIRTGISDGQFVEVRGGLEEGTAVITGYDLGLGRPAGAPRAGASPSANPFAPRRPTERRRE